MTIGEELQLPNFVEHVVQISMGTITLEGNLGLPSDPYSVVLFAHGSGSSRHSPRNRFVAHELNKHGIATLLIDLLTAEEETLDLRTHHLRFDIKLLTARLKRATDWLNQNPSTSALATGYFGASTGAAAALVAATDYPETVRALVLRGGRPDMAGAALLRLRVPTLLIVGEHDAPVIALNESALTQIQGPKQLAIVPGATHLFAEPGTLEQVAQLAGDWFDFYLEPAAREHGQTLA